MDAISAWQAVFFKKILMLLLPFSVLLYIPGMIMSLVSDLFLLATFDTVALAVLVLVFFSSALSLKTKKVVILVNFYLLGIILLLFLGWSGPGLIYLLAVSVLGALILDKRAGYITLGTNTTIFLLFVGFVNKVPFFTSHLNAGGIFAAGLNFILFNGLLVQAVVSITEALGKALDKEKETRTRLEEEVILHKKAREKAVESDRLKSMFLANVSHEIRTPMNGILGFTDLLKNPGLTGEQQKQFIGIIQKSGERMLATITDIIDISMIESGQVDLHLSGVDIHRMTRELKDFFEREAGKKNIEFRCNCRLGQAYQEIETDEHKLYCILSNLLKNAVKYTASGFVELNCAIEDHHVVFYIKDTGSGIPEDKKEMVYDRFTQAQVDEQGEYEGIGLGLSIAKAYIEMLEGEISFNSKYGEGTTFVVKIPSRQLKTYQK